MTSSDGSSSSASGSLSEAWVDFFAGWASGAMAVWTCQPVDTVLTRIQAGPALVATMEGATATTATATATATAAPSVAAVTTARGMIASSGMTSLWRGSSAMISAVPFQNALLMGGYGIGKQWATMSKNNENSMVGTDGNSTSTTKTTDESTVLYTSVFVGGCTGGIVQSFLMAPVEWVKVNQQVIGTSAPKASREMVQGLLLLQQQSQGGWNATRSSSWRGLNATLLRDGIPHGVWFASYEWCKNTMMHAEEQKSQTYEQLTVPIVSGAFAATIAWAVGYPFDIIKTRIQANSAKAAHYQVLSSSGAASAAATTATTVSNSSSSSSSLSIYHTALELIEEANGRVLIGLYRGFGLKLIRAIPASMIGFTTYEFVASQLRR